MPDEPDANDGLPDETPNTETPEADEKDIVDPGADDPISFGPEPAPTEPATDESTSEAAAEEQESAPVADSFDAELLGLAQYAGFDERTARSFGSVAKLEGAIQAEMYRRDAADVKPEAKPDAHPRFEAKLDDTFEEPLVDFGNRAAEELNRQNDKIAELSNTVQGLLSHIGAQQRDRSTQEFDGLITGLGDEYAELVGKGDSTLLDRNSEHYKARDQIWETMGDLRQGQLNRQGRADSNKALFDKAQRIVLGQQTQAIARNKLNGDVKKRNAQALAKPTHRHGKPLDPLEAAAKTWDDGLAATGMFEESTDQEMQSGLL